MTRLNVRTISGIRPSFHPGRLPNPEDVPVAEVRKAVEDLASVRDRLAQQTTRLQELEAAKRTVQDEDAGAIGRAAMADERRLPASRFAKLMGEIQEAEAVIQALRNAEGEAALALAEAVIEHRGALTDAYQARLPDVQGQAVAALDVLGAAIAEQQAVRRLMQWSTQFPDGKGLLPLGIVSMQAPPVRDGDVAYVREVLDRLRQLVD